MGIFKVKSYFPGGVSGRIIVSSISIHPVILSFSCVAVELPHSFVLKSSFHWIIYFSFFLDFWTRSKVQCLRTWFSLYYSVRYLFVAIFSPAIKYMLGPKILHVFCFK